ncbi:hypothetical protein GCM10007877_14730 [Marinibactrum halimedae]|uniref:Uncharacterized protein n=1 Tax=Marinibactrum halimedae TaxID=1444977 RepID=A0AA37WLA9_9GAMM|nr:hypothetical protein GCM10007877_14730 [Marinibactrum halimedae]
MILDVMALGAFQFGVWLCSKRAELKKPIACVYNLLNDRHNVKEVNGLRKFVAQWIGSAALRES